MNGNELLDKMSLIDPMYIEAAEQAAPGKNKIWMKWAALAACVCVIALAASVLPGAIRREGELAPEETSPALYWETVGNMEIVTEPYLDFRPAPSENGVITGGRFENDSFLTGKPMISGYGESGLTVDMSVTDCGIYRSGALESAMDHYGDSANYRVLIELFSDGVQIPSGGQQALADAQRLVELGYIVAIEIVTESESNGEIVTVNASYLFTLHATYEQLENFPADENLGYKFMLYDEVFGGTENDITSVNGGVIQ